MTVTLLCRKHGSYEGMERIRRHVYRCHKGITKFCSLKNKNKDDEKFFQVLSKYPDDFAITYG